MRPFRGLTKEGKLVYGWYLYLNEDRHYIIPEDEPMEKHLPGYASYGIFSYIPVIPETVGQSTGLKDIKRTEEYPEGQEIYGGDIVKVDRQDSFSSWNQAIIKYAENKGAFILQYTKPINPKGLLADCSDMVSEDKTTLFGDIAYWKLEIIGNIHQNPKLMEQDNDPKNP